MMMDDKTNEFMNADHHKTNEFMNADHHKTNEFMNADHHKTNEFIKQQIEKFSKPNQIEVLKLIRKNSSVRINENKSGVYINLTFLEPSTIEILLKYMEYVREQESMLTPLESQKEDFKNNFFIETI
jgi:hypothetical protein